MIHLTQDDVREFRELHRRETGCELTDDEARAYAETLIRVVAFAVKPERPPDDPPLG